MNLNYFKDRAGQKAEDKVRRGKKTRDDMIPSIDGKYKVVFFGNKTHEHLPARTTVQLEDFETFLAGESAKAGGKMFMCFEPEMHYEYDSKGNIKKNKKGEPILRGSSDAKDAARSMAKMAKQHGLDARVNTSGMLVFANPNKTVIRRAVVTIDKAPRQRKQRKAMNPILKKRLKDFRRGGKPKVNGASVPAAPEKKKGLISRLLGR